ncbi:hypothetical protein [Ruegeria arenilitoris]|uniref:hypothetical protein n=1 Tax=Ruegeria arenilitoris TaxID=1173585 RepID=UPI00147FAB61|nr:hypothetical protein [Ruegeria arenilitoris]
MEPKFKAKLVRGRQYSKFVPDGAQGDFIVFKHGVAVTISAETKHHLEQYAVDPVQTTFSTGEVEENYECKFAFEELDESP